MDPISVLLVDDSHIFRSAAIRFLEQYPEVVVVGSASEGKEALAQAQQLRPQIILIDLRMPGLSGLETIPLIKDRLPETKIIALTMLDTSGYRQAALAAGADDFISKSNTNTDLLPVIRRMAQETQ